MPSGSSQILQWLPLRQALSHRTQRALRRNHLSAEMNDISAEMSVQRRKNREELERLRAELAGSQQRLKELERDLMAARHAPSEEPEHLEPVMEECESGDEDVEMDMGMGGMDVRVDDSMDLGHDHADDTPAHSPQPEPQIATPSRPSPTGLSRQNSNNGNETPFSKRDQRIRDLEAQIAALRDDIQARVEEAQRRQEEDDVFHDAEEQLLVEENKALARQVEELEELQSQSPLTQRLVGEQVEVETVFEGSVFEEGMSIMTGDRDDMSSIGGDVHFRSSGRTISGTLVEIEEEEDDPRIADLEAENEKLQQVLATLNDKIDYLTEEGQTTFTTSEGFREQAELLKKENETIRLRSEKITARINQLEELEGERLLNVQSGAVQTDEITDPEKEGLALKKVELEAEVDELTKMHAAATEERRQLEVVVAELKASVKALELAVESGAKEKADVEGQIEAMNAHIMKLDARLDDEESFKSELDTEIATLRDQLEEATAEIEGLRLEIEELKRLKDKEVESLTVQMTGLTARISNFESTIDTLTEEVRIAKEVLDQKEGEIEFLESERETLRAQLEEQDDEIGDLGADKSALEVDIDQLETKLDTSTRQLDDAHQQIAEKEEQIEELLRATLGHREEKDAAIFSLEAEKEALEAQARDLGNEIDDANTALSDLKKVIDQKDQKIRDLEAARATLEDMLAQKDETIGGLEQKNSLLMVDIESAISKAATLQEENASLDTRVRYLESDVEGLNVRISDLGQTNLNLTGELTQRSGEKVVLENRVLGLEELNSALGTANELLQTDKNALEAQIEEIRQDSNALDEHNTTLRANISSLEDQITNLSKAASAADKAKEEFESTILGLRNRISHLEKAAEISESEKQCFEKDIARLNIAIKELEVDLEAATGDKTVLEKDLSDKVSQIESFKQSAASAASEMEGTRNLIASLQAEIDASKKAIKVAGSEKSSLEAKIEELEDLVEELEEEVSALKSEKQLMCRDIEDYQSQVSDLSNILDIARKDNILLTQKIAELEKNVASLESSLESTGSASMEYQQDLVKLRKELHEMKRTAQAVDEEKSIIAQKIQPYIAGVQPLDMAVEEVITELVMVKNRAMENERIRHQLEEKIRILAQDGDGEISPEEVVEKLTDRFKDVRGRVEKLYNRRRQLKDSPFAGYDLENFAWTVSNDQALEILGTLVEKLDERLFDAMEKASTLHANFISEQNHSAGLAGYLGDIAMHIDISDPQLKPSDVPGFVERHILTLDAQLESLEDQLKELELTIEDKNATIQELEAGLEEAAVQKSSVDKELVESKAVHDATYLRLTCAENEIAKLKASAEEDRMEIDGLEEEIGTQKSEEAKLLQQLHDQSTAHNEELEKMRREKVVAVGAVQNKLAEALDGKNQLQSRLEATVAEYASQIRSLEGVVAESNERIHGLDEFIAALKRDHQAKIEQFGSDLEDAENTIADLQQTLKDTETQAELDIATIQIELDEYRYTASSCVQELKDELVGQRALVEQLTFKLKERVAEIESRDAEIQQLKRDSASQKDGLEGAINSLEHQIQDVRFNAGKEEVRLKQLITDHEQRISELEASKLDLQKWLEEAETHEAQLDEDIKRERAEHQLYEGEAVMERNAIEEQKAEIQARLERTLAEKAELQVELEAEIERLQTVVMKKSQIISDLEAKLISYEVEKRNLELKITALESEKRDLEEELEIEREKGRDAMESLAQQAQTFMNRLGDRKNQYIREQKLRETKKRSHAEISSSSQSQLDAEWVKEPLSPASTSRRLVGTETVKRSKKRRVFGDSGIGVEHEEDEGFEGSVSMTAS